MSEASPPPKPRRDYRIGEKVPLEKAKLVVKPASNADDPATGPRGVFRNGRSRTI